MFIQNSSLASHCRDVTQVVVVTQWCNPNLPETPEPGTDKELTNVPGKTYGNMTSCLRSRLPYHSSPHSSNKWGCISFNKFAYLNHLAINGLNLAKCLIQGIKVTKYLDFCLTEDKTWDFSSSKGDNKVRAVSDNTVRVSTPACLIKWWTTYGSSWV